ncbi:hypothetical protein Fmac_007837 [Flemingia macrophylla]|uniref:Uncharacterized protein n=1 Tax=Flemingia macrophylla TaxID=520843 RepID=A0ABD1MVP7_9FABA
MSVSLRRHLLAGSLPHSATLAPPTSPSTRTMTASLSLSTTAFASTYATPSANSSVTSSTMVDSATPRCSSAAKFSPSSVAAPTPSTLSIRVACIALMLDATNDQGLPDAKMVNCC